MAMQSSTPTTDVSFYQKFKKHLSHVPQKNWIIRLWQTQQTVKFKAFTKREYQEQTDKGVVHKDVRNNCNTNQLSAFTFSSPHMEPHGVSGLGKHYHMGFHPKIVHITCSILRIPCDYV